MKYIYYNNLLHLTFINFMSHRALQLYRNLIRTSRLIPDVNESRETELRIRNEFIQNRGVTKDEEIKEFLEQGESRLRFLRTKARKSPYARRYNHSTRVVLHNDELIETSDKGKQGKQFAFCKDMRLDVESLKRHQKLIRRSQFLEKPPVR